jgi:hypothetical protein
MGVAAAIGAMVGRVPGAKPESKRTAIVSSFGSCHVVAVGPFASATLPDAVTLAHDQVRRHPLPCLDPFLNTLLPVWRWQTQEQLAPLFDEWLALCVAQPLLAEPIAVRLSFDSEFVLPVLPLVLLRIE